MEKEIIKVAYAAYLSGRGYYACADFTIPGTGIAVDVAAAMPRLRDLKSRLKRGFVPTGILHHLIGANWVSVEEIITRTGYGAGYVAAALDEAVENRWVEMDFRPGNPRFRILDYRVPARECVLAFTGTEELQAKLACMEELAGCYSHAMFIFPYALDHDTTERIVGLGGGIVRYHRQCGVFQETVPAEWHDIEDAGRFALIVEYILYQNVWLMTGETI